eukprot:226619-Heterocapsa_arctica.AAC.1
MVTVGDPIHRPRRHPPPITQIEHLNTADRVDSRPRRIGAQLADLLDEEQDHAVFAVHLAPVVDAVPL